MKRFLLFIGISALLASCAKDRATSESEFRTELTYVGGSRVRITVAAMNREAYYSYLQFSPQETHFTASAREAIEDNVKQWEEAVTYFKSGSFTDAYCYRGSRQFTFTGIGSDTDYRFILFQIHPKTHKLIGEPVEIFYHTRSIPRRNLTFDVETEGGALHITPSDPSLTYFWDYELSDNIADNYFFPHTYLYNLAGMYYEYGFLDSELSKGAAFLDFSLDDRILPDQEYTLVIAGCEEAEFTTRPVQLRFIWNGQDHVEVVEGLRESGII